MGTTEVAVTRYAPVAYDAVLRARGVFAGQFARTIVECRCNFFTGARACARIIWCRPRGPFARQASHAAILRVKRSTTLVTTVEHWLQRVAGTVLQARAFITFAPFRPVVHGAVDCTCLGFSREADSFTIGGGGDQRTATGLDARCLVARTPFVPWVVDVVADFFTSRHFLGMARDFATIACRRHDFTAAKLVARFVA